MLTNYQARHRRILMMEKEITLLRSIHQILNKLSLPNNMCGF